MSICCNAVRAAMRKHSLNCSYRWTRGAARLFRLAILLLAVILVAPVVRAQLAPEPDAPPSERLPIHRSLGGNFRPKVSPSHNPSSTRSRSLAILRYRPAVRCPNPAAPSNSLALRQRLPRRRSLRCALASTWWISFFWCMTKPAS